MRLPTAVGVVALLLLAPAVVRGERAGFEFGLGYSRVTLSGSDLDGTGGLAGQFGFSFSPGRWENVRLGLLLTTASYDEDVRFPLPPEPELFQITGTFADLDLITPEVRASWRTTFDRWFLEPGVGVGLMIGSYRAGHTRLGTFGHFVDERVRQTRVGLGVRPALRGGYHFDQWDLGFEASYLLGRLRFEETGGSLRELFIGGFIRWYF